jgi:hypothetical protein
MRLHSTAKLMLGGALLVGDLILFAFSFYRGIDWLNRNWPGTVTFLSSPTVHVTILLLGLGLCAWGVFGKLDKAGAKEKHAKVPISPTAHPRSEIDPFATPRQIITHNHSGWRLADGISPTISLAQDIRRDGCVELAGTNGFALDHDVAPSNRVCTGIRVAVKLQPHSYFYARVNLRDAAGEQMMSDHWLTFCIGDPLSKPIPDHRFMNEMVVPVHGRDLGNGWVELTLSLEDQVRRAYGDRGLSFSELLAVRVRNNLSIGPIWIV